jgi:hypothetical protein
VNDLRRFILWLAALGMLAVAVWGFHRDEVTARLPGDPENRRFRARHQVNLLGHEFHLPLSRMLAAWGIILATAGGLVPLATAERSSRWLGRWERRDLPPGGME